MRKQNLIESLESRQLFAAGLTLGPNNLYFNAVKGQSQTYQLRVTNSGDQRVILQRFAFVGDNASQFKVTNFSAPRSLGVGVQINVTVQYTAPSTYNSAIATATLRAFSNVPSRNGYANTVPVRAMQTKGTDGSLESSLQKIFNLYNLPIDSGETDPENYHFPSTPSSTSDEVIAQTFVKAGAGNVTVTPLGVFTNPSSPSVRMGYYTPGDLDAGKNFLWYVPSDTSQSVNPFYYGQSKFDPGSAEFGLFSQFPNFVNTNGTVRNVYSEKELNQTFSDSQTYNHFRVYPFVNQQNKLVPNAYIVAIEEFGVTNVADNNDLIFVVTNVKPAGSTPTLAVENPTGYPDNDTLVFNKVQIPDQYVTNIVRDTNKLTIRNSGQSPLVVSLSISGEYQITAGAGTNITLAPGEKRDLTIKLTTTNSGGDTAFPRGSLTITTNDPANATKVIALRGVWTRYSEQNGPGAPTVEPSAQQIINDIFNYTTVIPSNSQLNNGGNTQQRGDEILAEYFTAADSLAYVRVTELATFHNQTFVDSNGDNQATRSYMGYYNKGNVGGSYSELFKDAFGTGQMILTKPTTGGGTTVGVTTKSFRPTSATQTFGFVVEKRTPDSTGGGGEYSDYSMNTFNPADPSNPRSGGQFLRFFPAKDKDGVTIPNTYFMLHDYNRLSTNYDFNDNIYLISNIIPEGKVKAPALLSAVRNSEGARVFFSSPTDGPKITGFNVYRSTTATGVYTLLTGTPLVARPGNLYQDSTAAAATTYFYAVESVGASGAKSDRVTVKV